MKPEPALRDAIKQFTLRSTKRFKLSELLDYLKEHNIPYEDKKSVINNLEAEGLVFSTDLTYFRPRHLYFKKAQFLISPTAEELAGGFLIPGHRFLPFMSPEIPPWKAILLRENGSPIPTCTIRKRVRDLYIFYSLFSRENPHNRYQQERALGDESRMVEIEAFDFGQQYKEWKLKGGSGILLTVIDWAQGKYQIEPVPKSQRQKLLKNGSEWIQALEKGFQKSFEDLGWEYPIEEQISYAYYYAGKKVLSHPPIHLGGFVESSSQIHFVDVGTENRLWRSPHISSGELDLSPPPEPEGKSSSMGEILQDIGISIEEPTVEAYIRDAFYHGQTSPSTVLDRIFAGRESLFNSKEQMEAFLQFYYQLWNRVSRSYNPLTDRHAGSVREQILRVLDEHIAWLRQLDRQGVDPKELPTEDFLHSAKITSFLESFLSILNRKNPGTKAELAETLSVLPMVSNTLAEIRQRADGMIKKSDSGPSPFLTDTRVMSPQKTAQKSKPKGPSPSAHSSKGKGTYYVLKVQLEYIRPPIWRRIRVPGHYSLRDLHMVIQVTMGWKDAHLYEFIINKNYYGPENPEWPDIISDDSVTLEALQLQPKQRFLYTYDFGDNWGHRITVEKVLEETEVPTEQRNIPYCEAGRRACPPEDCGGYSGYEEIIEALHAPNKKKYRELLEWVGNYDPEQFDIEKVNTFFRK